MALAAVMLARIAFAQAPAAPRLLSPGVISTGDIEFGPALSPDGKTLYFCKGSPGNKRAMWILVSRLENGAWTMPELAPFSGRYTDIDPAFSPDGTQLFFASNRPTEGTEPRKDFDLWVVDRTKAGWSDPRNLGPNVNGPGSETTSSVTADGTLYIGATGRGGAARPGRRLYRSRLADGEYGAPEPLPAPIDAGEEESNQYVSPDGRFMIFLSKRGNAEPALYVSYSEGRGWTMPESIGTGLNAEYSPYTPLISPDGKTFYFTSVKGAFDRLPVAPMSYTRFLEVIRAPGNGLGDIYTVPTETLSLRPTR